MASNTASNTSYDVTELDLFPDSADESLKSTIKVDERCIYTDLEGDGPSNSCLFVSAEDSTNGIPEIMCECNEDSGRVDTESSVTQYLTYTFPVQEHEDKKTGTKTFKPILKPCTNGATLRVVGDGSEMKLKCQA